MTAAETALNTKGVGLRELVGVQRSLAAAAEAVPSIGKLELCEVQSAFTKLTAREEV